MILLLITFNICVYIVNIIVIASYSFLIIIILKLPIEW